ncbi:hypothetical protein HG536_0A08760 [Torulaspora globosa]|uniref:Lactoylglutathione lyase n=1 Tax=Torulaspora globosa TaxID=48254 RepID=A0A7G3ZC23_9SACH|nr:uncharacterized protein HG536_0A08760 [Torulaspora globosa]QLL31059.1 hypothetical protein HG536_0A08760 [Torulaspora globosa]
MATENKYYPIKIAAAAQDSTLKVNHTCVRVKNPARSIEFYQKHFGMTLLGSKDFPDMKFSLHFLTFPKEVGKTEQGQPEIFGTSGVLELTHNWGSENDPEFRVNNGNQEPHRGFGHICFSVADIKKTCERLEAEGVSFKKRMADGRQKDIAFALDPDGYWIELVQYIKDTEEAPRKDIGDKFNHTMIRVKDAEKSLEFYQNVLGMKLVRKSEHENAKFTLYFLAYGVPSGQNSSSIEGVLELTHNWGTENDPGFKYHNGNEKPQGYGHICVSCNDPAVLCNEIEQRYGDKISWGVKFNQGKMKNLAFIKDPDGYSIEIVPSGLVL